MDRSISSVRCVIEPLSSFDLSSYCSSSIRSISISSFSDSEIVIFIGTFSGSVVVLSCSEGSLTTASSLRKRNLSVARSFSISNSPVDTILVISETGKLIVLSGGSLIVIDYPSNQSDKILSCLGGVCAIAKQTRSGEFGRLGSGTRVDQVAIEGTRRERANNVFSVVIGKRLALIEIVLGENWKDKREEDTDGTVVVLKELQCVDGVKTIVWINDSIVVGTAKGYVLISSVTGQTRFLLQLSDLCGSPKLTLLQRDKVMLSLDNVGVVVDSDGHPVGSSLVFHQHPDSMVILPFYAMLLRDGKIELYHMKSGCCVQTVIFGGDGVGHCIAAKEEGGNEKFLTVATPTKVFLYQKLPYEEEIKDLIRKKNFNEAISFVEELVSDGAMASEMVSFVHAQVGYMLLYDLHFEEAVNHFLLSDMQPSEIFPFIMRGPNRWSLLVPMNRYWGLHPPPAPIEDVIDDGLMAIQRAIFLRKAGMDAAVDDAFVLNQPTRSDLLELASKNIVRYLEASHGKELSPSVKEGVDTLLIYLYKELNLINDMEKLASSENNCVVEELETILVDSCHLRALAFLYSSKGMPSKALSIWSLLARSDTCGREIAAAEASRILEDSSDQKLILQHLGWIADVNGMLAVRILTSERRATQLPSEEVIAAVDSKHVEILQRYIHWLIVDKDCNESWIHTFFALSLAKSSMESLSTECSCPYSNVATRESIFSEIGNNLASTRERFQFFLHSSNLYDVIEVLDMIKDSELWLEKAILCRRLGQETIVLQILALKLEDSEAAEQYCMEIGRPDAYMQLLDMYLDPQCGRQPMYKAALRLLHDHGESLDPQRVFETLSPDLSLQLAKDTIVRMLRARLHHLQQGRIAHKLCGAVDFDAQLARVEERSRHVLISDESLCNSCHTRLGTKLFAMYPDDSVSCYKCFRRQGESASAAAAGQDLKQQGMSHSGWLVTR